MVNPGAFRGSRKDFLMSKKVEYSNAVQGKYVADALANIQRQYLKRYPIDLPHNKEPEESFLAAVDDDAPDPEPEEPNAETMSESEYNAAVADSLNRKNLLKFRKKQIAGWLSYQYLKDNDVRSQETGNYMPYTSLVKQLTGKDIVRPRQKTPTNLWRKTAREQIENHVQGKIVVQERLGHPIPKSHLTSVRDRIARELFSELDEGTQREWREKALAEHRDAMKKYKEQIHSDPSMAPADLQMAIQGLIQFAQPILDAISSVTGWKVSMLAGGPEPAWGGRLSVISIHSGYTSGDVKMTYGCAERVRYVKHVVPSFGSFLKLCYLDTQSAPEECRARALPEEEGLMPMSSYEPDTDETTFHNVEPDAVSNKVESSQNNKAQLPTPVPPPASSTTAPSSESRNTHTTQDSMASDSNPFPIEELSDDEEIGSLRGISPLPSAPPSLSCSREPTPAPLLSTSFSQETQNATNNSPTTSAGVDSAQTTPSPAATSAVPQSANLPSSPQVLTSNEPSAPTPSATPPSAVTHPSNLVGPQVAVPTPASVSSNPSGGLTASATLPLKEVDKDGRIRRTKRKEVPMEVVQPVSKRTRTKTTRAMASEEQSGARKKRGAGKKAAGAQAGGKENSTLS